MSVIHCTCKVPTPEQRLARWLSLRAVYDRKREEERLASSVVHYDAWATYPTPVPRIPVHKVEP